MSKFTDGTAFKAAVEHYAKNLYVATGAAPGCDDCLPVPERMCNRPDCYRDEPCIDCVRARTEDPGDDWHDLANEPHFSWSTCDTCGTSYGGSRYPAHGIVQGGASLPEDTILHLDVCTDCLMYFANGDVPDIWYPSPGTARANDA